MFDFSIENTTFAGGNFEGVEEDDTYEDEGNEDQLLPGEQIGYPFKPYTSLRKGKWTVHRIFIFAYPLNID